MKARQKTAEKYDVEVAFNILAEQIAGDLLPSSGFTSSYDAGNRHSPNINLVLRQRWKLEQHNRKRNHRKPNTQLR